MKIWMIGGGVAVALAAVAAVLVLRGADPIAAPPGAATSGAAMSGETMDPAKIKVPAALTDPQKLGERAFAVTCASCHGEKGAGTDKGPPMMTSDYLPGHHGDDAFEQSVKAGVQQHDATFGNMPKIDGLTRSDVLNIIAYVRALQLENKVGG